MGSKSDRPWGCGTPIWVRDAALNDSDKSFTVPAGKVWILKSISAMLICTATVGNRSLRTYITDGTDELSFFEYPANATASQIVSAYYEAGGNENTNTRKLTAAAGTNVSISRRLPEMILPAGSVIRVYDSAAIDPAADDLTVVLHYVEYDA